MKFPLTMDLRKATLAESLPGQVLIDADGKRVMLVYHDKGSFDHAGEVVELLNLADRYRTLVAMEDRLRKPVVT